ncbi:MAG: hypothetical protein KDI54_14700 [Gammaproteobacteria bacterium]|nr:hypothetical protein [Gammaproteobacteria bacterium]
MKTQYIENLKINQFGDVDVKYYIAKGKQLRSQAIAEMVQSLFARVRRVCTKRAPHLPLKVNFRH